MTTPSPLRSNSIRGSVLAAAILGFNAASSQAAPITWGVPQFIGVGPAADLDVSTTGTLVGAFNVGNTGVSSTTVNGVLFSSFAIPNHGSSGQMTVGDFFMQGIFTTDNATFGFESPPFSTLSASYKTLLASAVQELGTGQTNSFFLRMTGLSIGAQYQFQWWANNSQPADPRHTAWEGYNVFDGNSVTLRSNTNADSGGVGQFAIGTFTADATSEAITFGAESNGYALLNAFQLRQLSVPEPSSALLCGFGAAGLMGFRRRSRKQIPSSNRSGI